MQLEWISEDAIPHLWLFPTPTRDAVVDSLISTKEQQQMDIQTLWCSCSLPSDHQICWRVLWTRSNFHLRLQTKDHGDLDMTAQGCSQSTKGAILPSASSNINCHKPLTHKHQNLCGCHAHFPSVVKYQGVHQECSFPNSLKSKLRWDEHLSSFLFLHCQQWNVFQTTLQTYCYQFENRYLPPSKELQEHETR